MIDSLTIINYESHKETILDFCDGINMLVGQTDAGKSSIKRAIEWVATNKPSGNEFRSHWGGETKVIMRFDDTELRRVKGKENYYLLDVADFKSFGQGVPEEIQKALNFSSLNLQSQFSSPFLLSDSAGEVARYMNKIVNLESIDRATKNINGVLRKEQTDLAHVQESIKELDEKKDDFKWLEEAEKKLEVLEEERKVYFRKKADVERLEWIITAIEEVDEKMKAWEDLDQKKAMLRECENRERNIHDKEEEQSQLQGLINEIETIDRKRDVLEGNLILNRKKFEKLMPDECPLCGRSG